MASGSGTGNETSRLCYWWTVAWVFALFYLHQTLSETIHQCSHLSDLRTVLRTRDNGQDVCLAWQDKLSRSRAPANNCSSRSQGSDFLLFIERPFSWNNVRRERLLSAIDRLQRSSLDEAIPRRNRFAVLQFSSKTPGAKPVMLSAWDDHVDVKELNRTLRVSRLKGKLSNLGLQQTFVFGAAKLLELLANKWIPKKVVPADGSRELALHQERDLHVVVFSNLQKLPQKSSQNGQDMENFNSKMRHTLGISLNHFAREWTVSITLLVSQKYPLFREKFGSPSALVTYGDGSHFNKALTLQKLISKGEAQQNTYQAHLLAKGVSFRVMEYTQLNSGFSSLLNEAASGIEYIHYMFVDKCSTNDKESVSSDSVCHYCSSIHGCVSDKQRRRTSLVSLNPSSDTQQTSGRVTLSGFSGSHADQETALLFSDSMLDSKTLENAHQLSVSVMQLYSSNHSQWLPLQAVVKETTPVWEWDPTKPFFDDLMKFRKPVVLKNSVVTLWSAFAKWSWAFLQETFTGENLGAVKYTDSFLTFDPDLKAPLKLNISLPYSVKNMTAKDFFDCVRSPRSCTDNHLGHYYFSSLPDKLIQDTLPNQLLFHTKRDVEDRKQFIWISSPRMITHTHFDQDFNIFVQVKGRKRFTLWSPWQHELMYVYPRVHPMWHKSRINFQQPDLSRFPLFGKSHASQVTVYPGDVLFIPPYTWHYVETLDEPAVSISTWSHDYDLYDHMDTIYKYDHKFDLIENAEGQMYALRLYLDMMVHELYGFNQTEEFFARLLHLRFRGLEDLFPPHPHDSTLCSRRREGKIPTAIHVHGYVKLDMQMMSSHFKQLTPEVMDMLFMDYVEEISAQVVGIEKLLAFFRYCFLDQEYYMTEVGSEEHTLWDHKTLEEESV